MQRNDVAGVGVLLGQALDAVAVKIQPDFAAKMFDAADIIRRQPFAAELRFDFPVPPAGVVLLGGENHGGVGRRPREIFISPVGGEPTGDSRMVDLQDQQQSFTVVGANHHKRFSSNCVRHYASKPRIVAPKISSSSACGQARAFSTATVSFSVLGTCGTSVPKTSLPVPQVLRAHSSAGP